MTRQMEDTHSEDTGKMGPAGAPETAGNNPKTKTPE
jgi:hypothetical protein